MSSIKLNSEISIDIPKLIEGGMVILANSGGGKSYAIRRIAEQAVKNVQVIILDPEGEFASLREKYDFILAGKNADVPVEVRSASLLATKLLELNKSAVIDLYELHPQERQRYVKLFCEALVNAPKNLYHPVLIILDEAHEYVPEGKPSEATWAVESLASKGRKRGQRLILASQRIAKISKNVTAECNNKLIGRASQDIDMKRAGDELGFNKEQLKELRQLKPGEFFAFGPAMFDDVTKIKIGEVKTAHAKVGYKGASKTPPPSDVIKRVLGELKDLPQEAEKEAKTTTELKKENADLKRKLTILSNNPQKIVESDPKILEKAILARDKKWQEVVDDIKKQFDTNVDFTHALINDLNQIQKIASQVQKVEKQKGLTIRTIPMRYSTTGKRPVVRELFIASPGLKIPSQKEIDTVHFPRKDFDEENKEFGKCSRAIYSFLFERSDKAWTKTQVAVAVGYSQNSGGFNNSISELSAARIINRDSGKLSLVNDTLKVEMYFAVDKSLEKWLGKLGACSRKIWEVMLAAHPDETWTKEQLGSETGYSPTSGGFNNSLSELSALGLIERLPGGMLRINPELFEITT